MGTFVRSSVAIILYDQNWSDFGGHVQCVCIRQALVVLTYMMHWTCLCATAGMGDHSQFCTSVIYHV